MSACRWFMIVAVALLGLVWVSASSAQDDRALIDSVLGPPPETPTGEATAPSTSPPAEAPATQPAAPAPSAQPAAAAAPSQEDLARLIRLAAEAGSGVIPRKDANGRIKGLICVGESPISTTFGMNRGISLARQKARQSAVTRLLQWMKEDVEVRETGSSEYALFLEGSGDAAGPTEQGKAVEKTSSEFRSVASGAVQGLSLKGQHVDAESKMLYLVYTWTFSNVLAANEARNFNPDAPGAAADPNSAADQTIPGGTTVVPSGKELDRLIDE